MSTNAEIIKRALKPCPFCGTIPHHHIVYGLAICEGSKGKPHAHIEMEIDEWNRRALPSTGET